MSNMSWDKPGKIEVISGAFFLMRHTALNKVGLLDEDFFMYGEDIDLSYRLLRVDLKIGFSLHKYYTTRAKVHNAQVFGMSMSFMQQC